MSRHSAAARRDLTPTLNKLLLHSGHIDSIFGEHLFDHPMAHAHMFEALMFQSNIASAESRVLTNYHLGF